MVRERFSNGYSNHEAFSCRAIRKLSDGGCARTDTKEDGNTDDTDASQRRWPQMIFTNFFITYLRSFVSICVICVLQS